MVCRGKTSVPMYVSDKSPMFKQYISRNFFLKQKIIKFQKAKFYKTFYLNS